MKRGQRAKAASLDRWRNQRRPPPPPPPPIDNELPARGKQPSQTRVPPPPLQDQPNVNTCEDGCRGDWAQPNKNVDRPDGDVRRSSMIDLKRRQSQQWHWARNNSVTTSSSRRQRRQSVICIDRSELKPTAVDAYPLAALVSNLVKPRCESDEARVNDEQVVTGVLINDGTRVRRGLPVPDNYFSAPSPMDKIGFLPPFPARRFVILPAGWFASADLRAPAALTAWFLPPGVRCSVAYSKPVKTPNTAARLWPSSEWAESTILSTDIPPSTNASLYG